MLLTIAMHIYYATLTLEMSVALLYTDVVRRLTFQEVQTVHVIRILRDHLGLTQTELAKRAGLTHADVNEMENKEPYGYITKYKKLADALHTSVQSLVMNDPRSVPLSFFEHRAAIKYSNTPKHDKAILGREGEEHVFRMEKKKLDKVSPVLSKLILPYYKMKGSYPGFDILSFDGDGTPVYIEVKTSTQDDHIGFYLTKNEYDAAEKIVSKGCSYLIYHFSYWNTPKQQLDIYDFNQMLAEKRITPTKYTCSVNERPTSITGIVHFREKMGITQFELAERTGIPATSLCKYEQGQNISVEACAKLTNFFKVPIDDLLKTYPAYQQETTT